MDLYETVRRTRTSIFWSVAIAMICGMNVGACIYGAASKSLSLWWLLCGGLVIVHSVYTMHKLLLDVRDGLQAIGPLAKAVAEEARKTNGNR
jgi:hypothetical protein